MKTSKTATLAVFMGLLLLAGSQAQTARPRNGGAPARQRGTARRLHGLEALHFAPSAPRRLIASDEGRAFLNATGHPLAQYAVQAFGEPAKETVVPARWWEQVSEATEQGVVQTTVPTTVPCSGGSGARFNLEPRKNALPQNEASADFLPNQIGAGDDLIVQAANDWRGNLSSGRWDHSVSGYYVHRSTAADCSTQFEGGLPGITVSGATQLGIGGAVVAADPERDAVFMADLRFGSLSGVGLFRASATTLLDAKTCPAGTHSEAQATSCWAATPPVLLLTQAGFNLGGSQPSLAVDERATGAGTGAGDVYVVGTTPNSTTLSTSITIAACSNALNCGAGTGTQISGSDVGATFPFVRVRPDGVVTISYILENADLTATIKFITCTPAGAPLAPTCGTPVVVANLSNPLAPNSSELFTLWNLNLLAFTYPKHANRAESGGKFTSFLVYDDCRNPYIQSNPPFPICLDAEVMLTTSADNGNTWSAPVSLDTASGHHFYPAITTDASTGIVQVAYYSTEGDSFNHEVRVLRNQINPGGIIAGAPQMVTTVLDPIDGDPDGLGSLQPDAFMGAVARGTGVSAQSRLYISFDSTAVTGTYEGYDAPELNNTIMLVSF